MDTLHINTCTIGRATRLQRAVSVTSRFVPQQLLYATDLISIHISSPISIINTITLFRRPLVVYC